MSSGNESIIKRSFGTVIDLNSPPYQQQQLAQILANKSNNYINKVINSSTLSDCDSAIMNKKDSNKNSTVDCDSQCKGKRNSSNNKSIKRKDIESNNCQDKKISIATISNNKRRKTNDDRTKCLKQSKPDSSKSSNEIDHLKLITEKQESDEYLKLRIEETFKAIEETWTENDRLEEDIRQLRLDNDQLEPICEQILQFHELLNTELDQLSD